MADAPCAAWTLACPWCEHRIEVNTRGGRGADWGSGYEAAVLMRRHVEHDHGKTWREFLAELDKPKETTRRLEE